MGITNFCLFGPPRLERGDELLPMRRSKGLALLAYVALSKQPQSRESLTALLWPELDEANARNNLRRELSLLKSGLEEGALLIERTHVSLGVDPSSQLSVDVHQFREHIRQASLHEHPPGDLCEACAAQLEAAVALQTDPFMNGFTLPDCPQFDEWQFFTRDGLQQELSQALQALVGWHRARGELQEAIEHARHWLSLDPLQEVAHQTLMRLYAEDGQLAAAVRQYEQSVNYLRDELGIEPQEATVQLYEEIRTRKIGQKEPAAHLVTVAQTPAPRAVKSALPPLATPLVGRENELQILRHYFAEPQVRLVTVVGPGGMGKTRLAQAFAWEQLEHGDLRNGVYFVSLASFDSAEQIVNAIAEATGFTFDSSAGLSRTADEQLTNFLRQKEMFLVLDNFEHLMAHRNQVAHLLSAAPAVRILVTSRERLYLQEEHVLSLAGLSYPPATRVSDVHDMARYDAVTLFVRTAQRVRHDFALDETNSASVASITRLTEGMPLGLELAAAWIDALPVSTVAVEIQTNLEILESNLENIPLRQRSIRAVFDSTWERLDRGEREAFAKLSVFRGSFSRGAAEEVAGIGVRLLQKMVGKSLLQHERNEDRYHVHEMLRQCAIRKLSDLPGGEAAVRERHSRYYCSGMQAHVTEIEGRGKRAALSAIDADYDNILAAWHWARQTGRLRLIDEALPALEHYYYWRGRFAEGEALFREAANTFAEFDSTTHLEEARARVRLHARVSNGKFLLGKTEEARRGYEMALTDLDEFAKQGLDIREDRAYVLMKMGDVVENAEEARRLFEESLALYTAAGNEWWAAGLHAHLGYVALAGRAYDEAQEHFARSLAAYERLGDEWQFGWVLDGLSQVAMNRQSFSEAERLAEQSLSIHRAIGLRDRVADSLATLTWIALARGKAETALVFYEEAVSIWNDLGRSDGDGTEPSVWPASLDGADTVMQQQAPLPVWLGEMLDERLAKAAADLPPEMIARARSKLGQVAQRAPAAGI